MRKRERKLKKFVFKIYRCDNKKLLKKLPENSIDSIVTDPPYGLSFMGKDWDNFGGKTNSALGGQSPANKKSKLFKRRGKPIAGWSQKDKESNINFYEHMRKIFKRCYRVLKPGGHLLVFGGSRTYHRMACAIEDAGFEIRDSLMWIYGSGFPKSHNVSKAIDKIKGKKRKVLGYREGGFGNKPGNTGDGSEDGPLWLSKKTKTKDKRKNASKKVPLTNPSSKKAMQWDGWGTALKPAFEPIILARKPVSEKNVALNVLKWGTGAINIDRCRVGSTQRRVDATCSSGKGNYDGFPNTPKKGSYKNVQGRWPANILMHCICDNIIRNKNSFIHTNPQCPCYMLDEQSGERPSGKSNNNAKIGKRTKGSVTPMERGRLISRNDTGGASRFFYCSKANKKEKGKYNTHPTVKPLSLMKYLVKLITPPNGVVLDPFAGTFTTCIAAEDSDFKWIACELEKKSCKIGKRRIQDYFDKSFKQEIVRLD